MNPANVPHPKRRKPPHKNAETWLRDSGDITLLERENHSFHGTKVGKQALKAIWKDV
jgi:hypothetical protein